MGRVRPSPAEVAPAVLIVAHAPRARTREVLRAGVPRRRARVVVTRSPAELARQLRTQLVDSVVVDLGGSRGDPLLAAGLAREFPSAAFFAITPFRPVDAPAIAECAEHGVADVLADGVDDAVLGPVAIARGFSSRFAVALADPPSELGLTSTLHLGAWRRIVTRAGQPVRTQELAASLGVTREHLSRSFALGPAATLKRTIDLVRLLAAAALAKNSGCDLRDVARILGYPSRSQLATTSLRLLGTPAESLARLRGVDVVGRIVASRE